MRRNEKSNSAFWYLIINYREIWTWKKFPSHLRQPSMGWSRCLYWKKWTAPYHFHNHRFNNHLRSFLAMTNLKWNLYVYLTVHKKVRLIGVQTSTLKLLSTVTFFCLLHLYTNFTETNLHSGWRRRQWIIK